MKRESPAYAPSIAASWREEGRLAKPGVVATVMSNLGLERHLASLGLTLERTAVVAIAT